MNKNYKRFNNLEKYLMKSIMKYLYFIFLLFSQSTFSFKRASLDCKLETTPHSRPTWPPASSPPGNPLRSSRRRHDGRQLRHHHDDSKRRYAVQYSARADAEFLPCCGVQWAQQVVGKVIVGQSDFIKNWLISIYLLHKKITIR